MTTKELITKLMALPENMEVYDYGSFEKEKPSDVFIGTAYIDDNDNYKDYEYDEDGKKIIKVVYI